MVKRLFFLVTIALPVSFMSSPARAQGFPEDVKTRPDKKQIIVQMDAVGQMPAAQRNARLNQILSEPTRKTPRSDFMFCLGAAYLGNYKAQACLGKAYEAGLGIVEDLSEAYTWYSVALENPSAAKDVEKEIGPDRDRVKQKLLSSYPAPSEDDLDDMVKAQKSRITQYQSEVRKAKN
jgi:TPR repeat protein